MTLSYSSGLLNRNLAPGISEFTSCNAPDITAYHPDASHWLTNHFLNSAFRGTFKNKHRQYAMNLIFRAQVSFADYHEARGFTAEYLVKGNPHNPATRAYFRAIARWESCLLNLQIFIDVMNKIKKEFKDDPVFEEGDGTVKQRSYSIANTVKHFGSDVFNDRHHEEHTVPLWLTNAGLQTHSHALTFNELAKPVSDVAITAAELQDPLSFGEHPK